MTRLCDLLEIPRGVTAVVGMVLGAAFCHNFGLASSAAGPTTAGRIAVAAGFVLLGVLSWVNLSKEGR